MSIAPHQTPASIALAIVGVAAIGPVLAPEYRQSIALAVLGAATGAIAGLIVTTPVAPGPLRKTELRLRVLITAPVVAIGLLPGLTSPSGPPTLLSVVACLVWIMALLTAVAFLPAGLRSSASLTLAGAQALVRAPADPLATQNEPFGSGLPPFCAMFKRSVDIVVALSAIFLVLPLMVVAAIATMLDSPGSWLFAQTRLGAGGRPFRILKIRTMVVDNDDSEHRAVMSKLIQGEPVSDGLYGKVADDPRRTRVGKLLRRLSVDELPQLWNVLRGDMSIVGPRPPLPWEAELYDAQARGRLADKPGLTGLWQVQGRNRLPFDQMVELDLRYFEQWSPMLDFRILARTPKAVFWSRDTE